MASINSKAFEELLRTGEYSDFTIVCQGTTFKLHKNILGTGSGFFKALFRNEYQETLKSTIDLPEDDPETIGRVIDYIYKGGYSAVEVPLSMRISFSTGSSGPQAQLDSESDAKEKYIAFCRSTVLVYQAADKFDIPRLAKWALQSLEFYLGVRPTGDQFSEVLELVYQVTPAEDAMRRFVVEHCIERHETLAKDEKVVGFMMRHDPIAWTVGTALRKQLDQANRRISRLELHFSKSKDKSKA